MRTDSGRPLAPAEASLGADSARDRPAQESPPARPSPHLQRAGGHGLSFAAARPADALARGHDSLHLGSEPAPVAFGRGPGRPQPPLPVKKTRAPAHVVGDPNKAAYANAFLRRIEQRLAAANLCLGDLVPEETRRHDADLTAQTLSNFRASIVKFGPETYARSHHLARGTSGKFHVAMGHKGELVAIKTLRTVAKEPGAGASTREVSFEAIVREARLMQRYVDADIELGFDVSTRKGLIKVPLAVGTLGAFVGDVPATDNAHLLAGSALRRVAEQLAKMHAEDVAHQDVKSANVLVFADGRIRAGDLGEAVPVGDVRAPWTLAFAAPELLFANEDDPPPDAKVDVWSLGLTVLDLLHPLKHLLPQGSGADDAFVDMIFLHQDLAALREQVVVDGRLDLPALAAEAARFPVAAYLQAAVQRDPALAEVVVVHALAPPAERAGAAALGQLAALLQPGEGEKERGVAELCRQRGEGRHLRALRSALSLRLEDEAHASGPPAAHPPP